jgi:hypothetical protein
MYNCARATLVLSLCLTQAPARAEGGSNAQTHTDAAQTASRTALLRAVMHKVSTRLRAREEALFSAPPASTSPQTSQRPPFSKDKASAGAADEAVDVARSGARALMDEGQEGAGKAAWNDTAAMLAGDLRICFARAQAVMNGSVSLDQRAVWVAALEKEASAAEEKLTRTANETHAAYVAVQQVGNAGMALIMRTVTHLKMIAQQGVTTANKAMRDATSADPTKFQSPIDNAEMFNMIMDLEPERAAGRLSQKGRERKER